MPPSPESDPVVQAEEAPTMVNPLGKTEFVTVIGAPELPPEPRPSMLEPVPRVRDPPLPIASVDAEGTKRMSPAGIL